MKIGTREIGEGSPLYFIGEIGVNHNGSVELAKKLIDLALEAGVDAVKFQSFKPKSLASKNAEKAEYQKKEKDDQESQLEMLQKLSLSFEQMRELKDYTISKGIEFLSSPFDLESVDELVKLDVNAIKVPSGEITNLWLLEKINENKIPVILSTGMSTLSEIEAALDLLKECDVALLHCVSSYPTPPNQINLNAINTLKKAFDKVTGFSDHTEGIHIPLAATAIGAKIIEKHFTLDKNMVGPDHAASLSPDELILLVNSIREVEQSFGTGIKKPQECEMNTMHVARKSLVYNFDLKEGEVLKKSFLIAKRPGTGLSISDAKYVLGRKLVKNVSEDDLVQLTDFN